MSEINHQIRRDLSSIKAHLVQQIEAEQDGSVYEDYGDPLVFQNLPVPVKPPFGRLLTEKEIVDLVKDVNAARYWLFNNGGLRIATVINEDERDQFTITEGTVLELDPDEESLTLWHEEGTLQARADLDRPSLGQWGEYRLWVSVIEPETGTRINAGFATDFTYGLKVEFLGIESSADEEEEKETEELEKAEEEVSRHSEGTNIANEPLEYSIEEFPIDRMRRLEFRLIRYCLNRLQNIGTLEQDRKVDYLCPNSKPHQISEVYLSN